MDTIEKLRADLVSMRHDLNDARDGWESAVEAVREADQALAVAETVQGLLVEALQEAIKHGGPYVAQARAALAAAGVQP